MDPNQFLQGGGAPAANFENIDDSIVGTIISSEVTQCRVFATGELECWPDGNPKMQLVITLQTDLGEGDDDGTRRIYAPKSKKAGSMFAAIQAAVKQSGGTLTVGGKLGVRYIGEEASEVRGFNPRKLYAAEYATAATSILDTPTATPAASIL
jgi:hypothetical protein